METVIVDSDTLRITATRGDTDIAVVTFSGIGMQVDDIPQEEFVKTLQGATHSQFFVVDKARSWYNATARDIASKLSPLLGNYRKVVTLGNSMGGFGAVYFASRLPNCRAAIAFVPQFSVDPAIVPNETRWREHRARITEWNIHHAMQDTKGDPELVMLFGTRAGKDGEHLDLFREHATPRTSIFELQNTRHRAAQYLKQKNLLRPVLDAVIVDDAGAFGLTNLLTRSDVPHTLWTRSVAVQ